MKKNMLFAAAATAAVAGLSYLGVKIFAPWIQDDFTTIRRMSRGLRPYFANIKQKRYMADLFDETVAKYPQKTFLLYKDESYTYNDVNRRANRVAHAAMEIGLQQGDVVALMMYNEPAFVWTYLGLQKIGVQMAFINYNLRSKTLSHCINVSESQILLIGEGLHDAVVEVKEDLGDLRLYSMETDSSKMSSAVNSFSELMSSSSTDNIDPKLRSGIEPLGTNVLVYTSGTTGLPKAAYVTNRKTLAGCFTMRMFGMTSEDILYECLPFYHSAATIIGIGSVVSLGATMVVKDKFSASQFWSDCRKYNVTVIQYVGELLRYLTNRPESPEDGNHCVKYAFGNGLRKDVWQKFQSRFKVESVSEFYAATECPVGFINVMNKFGAVGRSSPFLRKLQPVTFVQFDVQKDEPYKNDAGFCVQSGPDEVGLLLIPIIPSKHLTFEGYKGQKAASEKKILHDVFVKGDKYINTGDLLYVDNKYYLYFHDRVGDTFRWKGENVSTTEVANVICNLPFIHDANVYGVIIPGCEGRAGMASICLKDQECKELTQDHLDRITKQCKELLPSYARPRFIRLQRELELTSTFKQRKVTLQKEAFDISIVKEPLYYLQPKTEKYFPLERKVYEQIINGEMAM